MMPSAKLAATSWIPRQGTRATSSRVQTIGSNFQFSRLLAPSTVSCHSSVAASAASYSSLYKRYLATSNNPTAIRSEGDEPATLNYFGRKAASKEQRVRAYQHKLQRADQLRHRRRNAANQHLLKTSFRSWWDSRQAHEERLDRKARQAGLEWKIRVAVIVERLPVVLPDKEDYERDYETLRAYIRSHSGKEYPKEFLGGAASGSTNGRPVALTDEELIALLPESYKPASRETTADRDGLVSTTDRRLKGSVYLMMIDEQSQQSSFPAAYVHGEESLLEAAIRALHEHIGVASGSGKKNQRKGVMDGDGIKGINNLPIDLYYPSQAPLGVQLKPYASDVGSDHRTSEQEPSDDGIFGTKTFFMKVQYDDGMLTKKDVAAHDFAWLDRTEVVDRLRAQGMGDDDEKFYRYLL